MGKFLILMISFSLHPLISAMADGIDDPCLDLMKSLEHKSQNDSISKLSAILRNMKHNKKEKLAHLARPHQLQLKVAGQIGKLKTIDKSLSNADAKMYDSVQFQELMELVNGGTWPDTVCPFMIRKMRHMNVIAGCEWQNIKDVLCADDELKPHPPVCIKKFQLQLDTSQSLDKSKKLEHILDILMTNVGEQINSAQEIIMKEISDDEAWTDMKGIVSHYRSYLEDYIKAHEGQLKNTNQEQLDDFIKSIADGFSEMANKIYSLIFSFTKPEPVQ